MFLGYPPEDVKAFIKQNGKGAVLCGYWKVYSNIKKAQLQFLMYDMAKVNTLAKDVTENMDKFELGIALQKVYDFIWDEFCDWYIELAKYRMYHADEDAKAANATLWTLKTVLANGLKLLHPFIPFVSEEIYSALVPTPSRCRSITTSILGFSSNIFLTPTSENSYALLRSNFPSIKSYTPS